MCLPHSVYGLPLNRGVSPTQTTLWFLWINFTITKYDIPLQDAIKHSCIFLWFFFSIWFCLGFSPYVLSFLFFVLLGVCFVFTQLIVFPVVKVILFAMPPNTSYMSAIHNNFEVENYFLYKCAFFCIFQSLLLFFQFSSKLLFSLYYFTCCNCFVIYKIKVGLVYSFHHCQNLSEWTAIPLITIALFCFVLMIIALVILL